jgi:hypothetical protein
MLSAVVSNPGANGTICETNGAGAKDSTLCPASRGMGNIRTARPGTDQIDRFTWYHLNGQAASTDTLGWLCCDRSSIRRPVPKKAAYGKTHRSPSVLGGTLRLRWSGPHPFLWMRPMGVWQLCLTRPMERLNDLGTCPRRQACRSGTSKGSGWTACLTGAGAFAAEFHRPWS